MVIIKSMDIYENEELIVLRKGTPDDVMVFMKEMIVPVVKDMINDTTDHPMSEDEITVPFLLEFMPNVKRLLPNEWCDVLQNGLDSYTNERKIERITKDTINNWIGNVLNFKEAQETLDLLKMVNSCLENST